jgi:hypothetical protein
VVVSWSARSHALVGQARERGAGEAPEVRRGLLGAVTTCGAALVECRDDDAADETAQGPILLAREGFKLGSRAGGEAGGDKVIECGHVCSPFRFRAPDRQKNSPGKGWGIALV